MPMVPLADRVLVRPDPRVTETKSGLSLVEDWPQDTSGIVTAVGASVRDVAVGEHVLFSQQAGQELAINDSDRLLVLRERDVIAVIEGTV